MLDKIRRFAAAEPVITANALAILAAIVTWLVSDSTTATAIIGLISAIVGTAGARQLVTPEAKAKARVTEALYTPAPGGQP
jgi:hypothetical protein